MKVQIIEFSRFAYENARIIFNSCYWHIVTKKLAYCYIYSILLYNLFFEGSVCCIFYNRQLNQMLLQSDLKEKFIRYYSECAFQVKALQIWPGRSFQSTSSILVNRLLLAKNYDFLCVASLVLFRLTPVVTPQRAGENLADAAINDLGSSERA